MDGTDSRAQWRSDTATRPWRTASSRHWPRERQQDPNSNHCVFYAVSHAQFLAFGYDTYIDKGFRFPPQCRDAMRRDRRLRMTQDLMSKPVGFSLFSSGNTMEPPGLTPETMRNSQYYPILHTRPSIDKDHRIMAEDFPMFGADVPREIRQRRSCYTSCPSKHRMVMHCYGNKRFYPGYRAASRPGVNLDTFRSWVEDSKQILPFLLCLNTFGMPAVATLADMVYHSGLDAKNSQVSAKASFGGPLAIQMD